MRCDCFAAATRHCCLRLMANDLMRLSIVAMTLAMTLAMPMPMPMEMAMVKVKAMAAVVPSCRHFFNKRAARMCLRDRLPSHQVKTGPGTQQPREQLDFCGSLSTRKAFVLLKNYLSCTEVNAAHLLSTFLADSAQF